MNVSLKEFNFSEMTIEVVMKLDSVTDPDTSEQSIVSCLNNGGAGIVFNQLNSTSVSKRGKISFDVYTNKTGNNLSSVVSDGTIMQANKIYSIAGSVGKMDLTLGGDKFAYETSAQLLGINGNVDGIPFNTEMVNAATGTNLVIGGSPLAGAGANTQFKGTIYCVRIYDRALTEEEIKENFKIDQQRYGIE